MTAPRKPVAWMRPDLYGTGWILSLKKPDHIDAHAIYPDLQPLWALVEKWEKEAQTFADAGGDIAMAEAAVLSTLSRKLRDTLEAMQ